MKNESQQRLRQAMDFHQNGRLKEAASIYENLLNSDKHNPHYLFLLGSACFQMGERDDGLRYLLRSIAIRPNATSYNNLGVMYSILGDLNRAIDSFNSAIRLEPSNLEAYCNLSAAYRNAKQADEAISCCKKALALSHHHPQIFYNYGNALGDLGKYKEAELNYDRAIDLMPNYPEAHFGKAYVLNEQRLHQMALVFYDKAIELRNDFPQAHFNRGKVLGKLGRFDDAIKSYDTALDLDGSLFEVWNNKGLTFQLQSKFEEALLCFDRALSLNPRYIDALWNKSLLCLLLGDYRRGFELYEARWETQLLHSFQRFYPCDLWRGVASLYGKTILIYPEQGLGDIVHFSRYIPKLVQMGARVIFEVPPPLADLMRTLHKDILVVKSGAEMPEFDFYCPIMSLAYAFRTLLNSIPAQTPYLYANIEKAQEWRKKIVGAGSALKVGLVWSGGARENQPKQLDINVRRNVPLALLKPLKKHDIHFFSLQKGDDATAQLIILRQNNWDGPEIEDLTEDLNDFSDTAAFIENLDLIISVDTSTAHVAAALGKPVWLLNRFDTDWRWLLDRKDSPWYPSMRLFRQPKMGDWESVISEVSKALDELISLRNTKFS